MATPGIGGLLGRVSRSLALAAELATSRFPAAVIIVLAIALLANLAIEDIYPVSEADLVWLTASLGVAFSASVATRLAGEAHAWRARWLLSMPIVTGALAGLLIWYSSRLSVLAPPLGIALTLAIPLAPYIARPDDRKFWTFTLWATVGVTLAFVSVLLFVLGVSAILEMVRYLFDVGLSSKAYEHIYTTALTLVGPLFALGRIPTDFDETVSDGTDDRLAAGVRFLFDWVGAPLALATAVVLHLYAAKIVVLGEWPKNEIGWIVSVYSVIVLAFRVAVEPFAETGGVPTRLFGRLWALLLFVPVALLSYAAGLRILSEGVTLERYYLALVAITTGLVIAVQFLPRLRGDIRLVAGLPLLLLALSSVGPWGVADVVGRSQTAMIRAEFAKAGPEGEVIDVSSIDEPRRSTLRSRIDALVDVDEEKRVLALLPETKRAEVLAKAAAPDELSGAIWAALGLDYGAHAAATPTMTSFVAQKPASLDTRGFDIALIERAVGPGDGSDASPASDVTLTLDAGDLVVRFAGAEDRFPLGSAMVSIPAASVAPNAIATDVEPLVFGLTSPSGKAARLRLTYATLEGEARKPTYLTATVLLKRADWPAQAPAPASLRSGE